MGEGLGVRLALGQFAVAILMVRGMCGASRWWRGFVFSTDMKKFCLLTLVVAFSPLFTACERQNWEETKMFHDVPKKAPHGSEHGKPTAEHKEAK